MPNLVGLAFTSPQIAIMVTDRDKFRVHFYQNRPNELHAFLQERDPRKPVVLCKSVHDLTRIRNIEGVHSFLLFDDPEIMSRIEGINILDALPDSDYGGFSKRVASQEDLNSALSSDGSFSLDKDAISAVAVLAGNITFRELYEKVVGKTKVSEDFLQNVCLYLVGALQKRSYTSRVQKPGLSAGISVESMAELDKFIEHSPPADRLGRAFYEVYVDSVPPSDAAIQLEADLKDLLFVIEVLSDLDEIKFHRNPREKPLVIKKKRKRRRLTKGQQATQVEKQKGGRSLVKKRNTTVDEKALEEAQQELEKVPAKGFDLIGTLKKIDKATAKGEVPYAFSRMACARLCGLVKARPYNAACKQAVLDGAEKSDVTEVRKFLKEDPEATATNLWQAYCRTSYFVGVDADEAAKEFSANPSVLKAVMAYKPMAYIFEYVEWPKDME